MSWLAIVVAVVAIWLAIKMVGALMKMLFWAIALAALYWLAAPYLGLPEIFPSPQQIMEGEPAQPPPQSLPEPGT